MPVSFDEPRVVTFDAAKVFDVRSQVLIRTSRRSLKEARVAVKYLSDPAIIALAAALPLVSACGGRTQLVPAYQIGRLSSDAIVANDAGVRVVVRTAAWSDSRVQFTNVLPIEITLENGSTEELSIHHRHVVLVMNSGRHISAFPPATLLQTLASEIDGEVRLPIDRMRERALAEGTLPRERRRTGFLYFQNPADTEQLDLKINLISVESGKQFGTIIIPFVVD